MASAETCPSPFRVNRFAARTLACDTSHSVTSLDQALARERAFILDGPMGTQLAAMGLEMGGQNCLSHPDAVLNVHRAYVAAGCQAIVTNTLTMNRICLESHGSPVDVRAVNLAGARLAREAAGNLPVLGNISSTGQILEPYGDLPPDACEASFREQADILAQGGVDGFVVETFVDANEALAAVKACKAVAPELPVLATLSFQSAAATLMGQTPSNSAAALVDAGASAVGANCTSLPFSDLAAIAQAMNGHGVPLIVRPNAGKPRWVNGRPVFDMTAEDFATGMAALQRCGVTILGGCCGTTPAHLALLAKQAGQKRLEQPGAARLG